MRDCARAASHPPTPLWRGCRRGSGLAPCRTSSGGWRKLSTADGENPNTSHKNIPRSSLFQCSAAPTVACSSGRVAKVGRWDTVVDLRLGKRGSRGGPTSKARSFRVKRHCLAQELTSRRNRTPLARRCCTVPNLGSHSLQETGHQAARPRECRVHDIPRAQCFVPSF